MHWLRNIQLLQGLGAIFNTLSQGGCMKHHKTETVARRRERHTHTHTTKQAETQELVLCRVQVINTTCLKCWNITFNKGSIPERVCLQTLCLLISVQFLLCIAGIFDICSIWKLVSLVVFTWRHPHRWEFFRETATSPLIQKCDFEWSAVRWFQLNGCLLDVDSYIFYTEFLISFCDSRGLSLFIQLPCVWAYRLCILLPS